MPYDNDVCRCCPTCGGPMFDTTCLVCPAPAASILDIPRAKQALRSLTFHERTSLCDAVGVHFACLEAVLTQPGSQQSSLTADQFRQLVEMAATRYPKFGQLLAI